jgi:zinc transporter ZupT
MLHLKKRIPEIFADGVGDVCLGVHTQETIRELLAHGQQFRLTAIIPYTLIAGLFLSNFPEALASSMHMYKYGWSKLRILSMWSSIMLMTALGAGVGFALAKLLSEAVLIGVQGFAAGAMLTMIASSMIPEAVHLCGPNWTGISVLLGFMATNLFQMI